MKAEKQGYFTLVRKNELDFCNLVCYFFFLFMWMKLKLLYDLHPYFVQYYKHIILYDIFQMKSQCPCSASSSDFSNVYEFCQAWPPLGLRTPWKLQVMWKKSVGPAVSTVLQCPWHVHWTKRNFLIYLKLSIFLIWCLFNWKYLNSGGWTSYFWRWCHRILPTKGYL